MNEKKRKHRDFIQNVAIALLSVSAVFLFAQTQVYNLGVHMGSSYISLLSGSDAGAGSAAPSQAVSPAAPVRIAITGPYGRYGNTALSTADAEFEPLDRLLGEVLGSARTYTACDSQAFRRALETTSVYYDFLEPLPLSILAGLVGGTAAEDDISARRLVVSAQDDGVFLYLWDGGDGYFRCSTAISMENLESAAGHYELGNAMFAFDRADTETQFQDAAPYSLFLDTEPALPVLSAEISLTDTDRLLTALKFNPNTKNRYQESMGVELIMESERALRIYTDGSIQYRSGGDPALTVESAGELPTLQEAVTGANALLHALLSPGDGEASLYLQSVRRNGAVTTLTFGYQMNGVPIRFADGGSAATVTLSGSAVSMLELRFRRYTPTETVSLLLPLRQALAIAVREPGAELSIGYADSGSGAVSANWLAD
ncbi:MAG: hypothetical protein Q4C45_08200 [Oscillospiraceae bacterium]|nr:hypothetical protein [Oscillospiraceae bacterium]